MIHHIVLFKFYPGTTDEQINTLAKELEILKEKIPGVVKYVWGPSVSIENFGKGYTHGFIMTFDSPKARDNYVPHSLHKELVQKYVDPICDLGLVFDLEEK
ncbi:MAG: Stress responsive alpha-beta barrel domain protein [Candidatus Gottesmanbacteria bacterium GW2011_GWC2_39_8]|uniref:Stress responsive alpha-beta barrel domain protein n=1 Tax=Candidatus Gottesmanbacteria bacterium GW2011_GWC2_39_8 TaxID=1618450 RepID=A0A0G0PUG4_9BACT|nr:MAG: Stress responsive alpha-beta barrel domain protein [Candidatus Gottesmanbacteria bacterium GW2011_GWC2_39_8]